MVRSILTQRGLGTALVILATAGGVGCSGSTPSAGAGESGHVAPNEVASLEFSPSPLALRKGDTKALKVTAVMGDGTKKDVTSDISYSSDNIRTATVDRHGTIVGTGAGVTTIRVSYKGASGDLKVTVAP